MKKIFIYLIVVLLAANQSFAQIIKIKGSDTVLPLTQLLAEEYMKRNIDVKIIISGGGSETGIKALLNGNTDIAQSARELTAEQKSEFNKAQTAVNETIIAYDALAIVVNPANEVNQLTLQQLEAIFTGGIRNWKEVGGIDQEIIVYTRETSSGTYAFFKDHVLNGKAFASSALRMPATGAIAQSVSQVAGAIGYIGLAYIDKSVKPVQVSDNKGKSYEIPSVETVTNKIYPISRPLYYIYPDKQKDVLSPFINYVLSHSGQQFVLKAGYVPVK